jgi:hypothetical protein
VLQNGGRVLASHACLEEFKLNYGREMAQAWQLSFHAGGMAACSRWLSVAIPPDKKEASSHPEGDA